MEKKGEKEALLRLLWKSDAGMTAERFSADHKACERG
jgi:hypothetical protein